jgi:hypothetical protein
MPNGFPLSSKRRSAAKPYPSRVAVPLERHRPQMMCRCSEALAASLPDCAHVGAPMGALFSFPSLLLLVFSVASAPMGAPRDFPRVRDFPH